MNIEQLHQAFESLTSQKINQRACERLWYDFAEMGFTVEDLTTVVKWQLWKNKTSEARFQRKSLRQFIGDLEWFASTLGLAQAEMRNKKPTPTPAQQIKQAFSPVLVEDLTSTATTHAAQTAIIQALSKK